MTPEGTYAFSTGTGLLQGVTYGNTEVTGDPEEQEVDTPFQRLVCTVAMGGENVTTAAFDSSTGEIEIDEVTGDIVITTSDVAVSS